MRSRDPSRDGQMSLVFYSSSLKLGMGVAMHDGDSTEPISDKDILSKATIWTSRPPNLSPDAY